VDFSSLSQAEKEAPLDVKWLESNDVLTAEVEFLGAEMARVTAALAALRSVSQPSEQQEQQLEDLEEEEGDLQNRQFVVDSMLAVLAHQVYWKCLYCSGSIYCSCTAISHVLAISHAYQYVSYHY
jgi:hypothetical protein